jgi:uncharacterized damage-inducible protein DinB
MVSHRRLDSLSMQGSWRSYAMKVIASRFALTFDALLLRIRSMSVAQLEWQIKPGCNTIGMLLAHIGVTEAYWLTVADLKPEPTVLELKVKHIVGIGIDDDGIPIPATGSHPLMLQGKTAAEYSDLLRAAREHIYTISRNWTDDDLLSGFQWDGAETSLEWVICHVLDHSIHHAGQVAYLDSMWHREQAT